MISGRAGSREGFPVDCTVAITAHKAQGLTAEQVWVDLGNKEFSTCLTYVAFSRTTTLDGLRLAPFDEQRLLFLKKPSLGKFLRKCFLENIEEPATKTRSYLERF